MPPHYQILSSHHFLLKYPEVETVYFRKKSFPGASGNAGDPGLIPGSGRFPGEGNGYTFQYSCLENSMNRGAWQAVVCGVGKSQTRLRD